MASWKQLTRSTLANPGGCAIELGKHERTEPGMASSDCQTRLML